MKEFIVKEYETFPYKNAVNEMPELIRCKDCKYFYKEERYCVLGTVAISDGYCYLGERKEE